MVESPTSADLILGYIHLLKDEGVYYVKYRQARYIFVFNLWPEFIVCTCKGPETQSAAEELLVDKRDYHDIYKEGLGTSVDSARLKTG